MVYVYVFVEAYCSVKPCIESLFLTVAYMHPHTHVDTQDGVFAVVKGSESLIESLVTSDWD